MERRLQIGQVLDVSALQEESNTVSERKTQNLKMPQRESSFERVCRGHVILQERIRFLYGGGHPRVLMKEDSYGQPLHFSKSVGGATFEHSDQVEDKFEVQRLANWRTRLISTSKVHINDLRSNGKQLSEHQPLQ